MIQERHPGRGLSREQRVTRPGHFAEAYTQRQKYAGKLMIMWLRSSPDARLRLGVVASKKVGKATQRAKAKRLLREAYRNSRDGFHGQCDIILTARRAILDATLQDVEKELLGLARRAGIVES